MIHDPLLKQLTQQQTSAFNSGTEPERVVIYQKIQQRQEERKKQRVGDD